MKSWVAITLVILCISATDGFGQYIWTKNPMTPVFTGSAIGSWNKEVWSPTILYNPDSARYEMWCSTGPGSDVNWQPYEIAFAVSKDAISWTLVGTGPVLRSIPGTWEANVCNPSVLREGGSYKMWYSAIRSMNGSDSAYIAYATSLDGINWTRYAGNPVLRPGPAAWEYNGIGDVSVMRTGGVYTMWYDGGPTYNSNIGRIGRATSVDGIHWTKDDLHNPVLDMGGAGQWDQGGMACPRVFSIRDTMFMVYSCMQSNGGIRRVGLARSTNGGTVWQKYGSSPVLTAGSPGSWDQSFVQGGFVLAIRDTLHMWYDGFSTATNLTCIGQAISPLPYHLGTQIRVRQDYATIQAAINASVEGDTVLVDEGTYYENIRYNGRHILVGSQFAIDGDTSHISRTIIDGSHGTNPDSMSVVSFLDGEDTTSVLCGFTITGGAGTRFSEAAGTGMYGGGIYCRRSARICHNHIVHNSVTSVSDTVQAAGGGIECMPEISGATMTIALVLEHNVIAYNTATSANYYAYGGGIDAGGYGDTTRFVVGRVVDNAITDNVVSTQATGACAYAGGFSTYVSSLLVERDTIARNSVLAPNCTTEPSYGGGFDADGWFLSLVFRANRVVDNVVQTGNSQSALGGGISVMTWDSQSHLVLSGNLVAHNRVIGDSLSSGGGIYVQDGSPWLENNIVVENSAMTAGGVGFCRADATITDSQPTMINNTIAFNRATKGKGAGILSRGVWSPNIINSIAWGDTGTQEIALLDGSSLNVFYSDIQGGWPSGSGNINVDALFVAGDPLLNLQSKSPCIGRGTDSTQIGGVWYRAPLRDFNGDLRPRPVGPQASDIGAQEEQITVDVPGQGPGMPTKFALEQNYPNPFNPTTKIRFTIVNRQLTIVKVYDVLGQEVATIVNEVREPGTYTVQFNASGLASGVYFYRLTAGTFVRTQKMTLVR